MSIRRPLLLNDRNGQYIPLINLEMEILKRELTREKLDTERVQTEYTLGLF